MIIGRDLLKSLRIIMDFSSRTIEWNVVRIPKESASAPVESFHIEEDPGGVDEMIRRLAGNAYKKILRAKYEKAYLAK